MSTALLLDKYRHQLQEIDFIDVKDKIQLFQNFQCDDIYFFQEFGFPKGWVGNFRFDDNIYFSTISSENCQLGYSGSKIFYSRNESFVFLEHWKTKKHYFHAPSIWSSILLPLIFGQAAMQMHKYYEEDPDDSILFKKL